MYPSFVCYQAHALSCGSSGFSGSTAKRSV